MRDYQESVTTGQTDGGQSNSYVPLCFAGDTKSKKKSLELEASWKQNRRYALPEGKMISCFNFVRVSLLQFDQDRPTCEIAICDIFEDKHMITHEKLEYTPTTRPWDPPLDDRLVAQVRVWSKADFLWKNRQRFSLNVVTNYRFSTL